MKAYVSLGSNLGDRAATLDQAIRRLRERAGLRVTAVSPVYETEPEGILDQPKFLNQVAELETELDPEDLLGILRGIENDLGRVRRERWGPRTIDLDLLLVGDRRVDSPTLKLPHPRLHERRFVLEPLADVAPDLAIPGSGGRTVRQALNDLLAARPS